MIRPPEDGKASLRLQAFGLFASLVGVFYWLSSYSEWLSNPAERELDLGRLAIASAASALVTLPIYLAWRRGNRGIFRHFEDEPADSSLECSQTPAVLQPPSRLNSSRVILPVSPQSSAPPRSKPVVIRSG